MKGETMKRKTMQLGVFDCVSGTMRVTDPCYDRGTWCAGELRNCALGEWTAILRTSDEGMWGERCAQLIVMHRSMACGLPNDESDKWQRCPFEVGVDSGQAGVFDDKFYKNDSFFLGVPHPDPKRAICEDEPFYSRCCGVTSRQDGPGAGVLIGGAVSSSGYGDGGYDAYFVMDEKKQILAIRIDFITEGEEDDE